MEYLSNYTFVQSANKAQLDNTFRQLKSCKKEKYTNQITRINKMQWSKKMIETQMKT